MRKNKITTQLGIHLASALDDIAIRNYYLYYLLRKLVSQNKKSLIGAISQPLALAATLMGFLFSLITPTSIKAIVIIYSAVMALLIGLVILDKSRQKGTRVLEDEIYLAIHLDQVTKYARQLKLTLSVFDIRNEVANAYIEKSAMILKESLDGVNDFISILRGAHRYPRCLCDFGWNEKFANERIKEAKILLENVNQAMVVTAQKKPGKRGKTMIHPPVKRKKAAKKKKTTKKKKKRKK